jgi:hypothetical protein
MWFRFVSFMNKIYCSAPSKQNKILKNEKMEENSNGDNLFYIYKIEIALTCWKNDKI